MKGRIENKLGTVMIDPEVIAMFAGTTAIESFGIVGMVKLLKKESLTHGINVKIDEENLITLDFHVIVSYGVSISAVADNLVNSVKYKVEEFAGMKIKQINIFVDGVRVID